MLNKTGFEEKYLNGKFASFEKIHNFWAVSNIIIIIIITELV